MSCFQILKPMSLKQVKEEEVSTSKTTALITAETKEIPAMTSDEQMAFLMKRFQKFMKKKFKQSGSPSSQKQQKI